MKKRLLSFLLTVLMLMQCVSMVPFAASAEGEQTYEKVALADIKATDTVIIVSTKDSSSYAMSNDNGTSKAPTAVAVTVTNDTITTAAANILWNIANDNGDLTIYPAGTTDKWLYCTSTNNGVRVGTNANKVFTIDSATNYLKHTATSRYLGVYNNQDWRCYTNTTGNTAGQTFAFYKLQEAKHEHAYAWNNVAGTGGSHTLACANTDGKCDVATTTEACTWEDGYCSVCGAEAPECAHPTTTEVPEDPATCTEGGYTAGVQCTVCNQYTSGHEEIEALKHNLVTDAAVDATCTETGLTEGSHCDREGCGHIEVAQEETLALGHNYVNCVCSRCGDEASLSYTFDYTTGTNATQIFGEEEGLVTLVYAKADGSTPPTWYESGYALRFYKNNTLKISTLTGYYIKSVTLTLISGSFAVDSGEITNVTDGSKTISGWAPANKATTSVVFTSNSTTQKYAQVQSIAIELAVVCTHESTVAIGEPKDATCTEEGITAGVKCAACGEVITPQEELKATGHNFVDGVCTNEGCDEIECDHVDKGVTLGEITKQASCTETGLQEQFCAQCNQPLDDKVLDKLAHTPETDEAKEPTCIATGLTEGSHCSVCTEVLTAQEEVPMIDHDYEGDTCTVCGDVMVTGDLLADFQFGANGDAAHKDGSTIGTAATFTSSGYALNLTSAAGVYGDAFDAKGNSALKLGTGSKAASFSFTVVNNVNTVVLYIAAYKENAAKINVSGTEYTVTSNSNEGDYTKIVVDTSTNKTVTLETLSGGYRAMVNSIEFWGEEVDKVAGYTTTLGENIGVNFYMQLTEATLADGNACMRFTLPNGTTKDVSVSDATLNNGVYKFTADIAVKEMAVGVKAELITAEGTTVETTYSVKEYAEYIIEPTNNYTENEVKLAKAMLNYGAYAQLMFGYKTDTLANSVLAEGDQTLAAVGDLSGYAKKVTDNITGVTYAGTSTLWVEKTAINHYFTVTGENITFKLNGQALPVQDNGDYKYVTIDGIVAKDMKTTYQLVVSNGTETQTIDYSVYSYFYDILNGNYTDAQKDAMKAAYLYSQAALDYLAN